MLCVLAALLVGTASSARSPERYGDRAGFAMGGPWTWLTPQEQARDLDRIARTGAGWIRVSFPWSSLQFAPDRYDWSVHDRIVRMANERDLQVLANVAYTPGWAQPDGCQQIHCPPASPQAFAAFVGEAVARYSSHGVSTWEIWNEPNLTKYWRSGPDPERYADLLQRAYAAAKEADPSVTVLSAGLSPSGRDTADGLTPLTFLERMYDALDGEAFDALAMHPYTYPRAPLDHHPTNTFTMLPRIHDLMKERGDGHKRIWITEFGFWTSPRGDEHWQGSVTEQQQARYLAQAYEAAGERDWIGPMLWFSFRDSGTGELAAFRRDDNFGLIRRDGSSKPAVHEFVKLMRRPLPR